MAKGFHSTQHYFNDVCEACVVCEYGLVHIPHRGLWSNWARAFSKMSRSHFLHSNPGVIQERSKTLHGTASARKDYTGGGRAQRANRGCGWADDGLALSEWESFARLVAPMAEEVQTAVDARMEALRQQHNIDVQVYKARIDHLETMLASLGICEPLELHPSTSGASISRSIQDDVYTADIFTENQGLRQNLENVDRINASLQEDLNNANRVNARLRADLDHANRANVELHAALADRTNQLKEQEAIARQKSNDHSQLLERF